MTHCQLFKPSIVDSVRRKYTSAHSLFCFIFPLFEGNMVLLFAFLICSVNHFVFLIVSSLVLWRIINIFIDSI